MGSYQPLSKVTEVFGHPVETLEDAAYFVRQHIIEHFERDGARLVRELRSASSEDEIGAAEFHLAAWLSKRPERVSDPAIFARRDPCG
jgi:hypothetical protein